MWARPWGYKEGVACGAGLIVTGLLLQWSVGSIDWRLLAWPVNMAALVLYLFLLALAHLSRKRIYCFEWLSHHVSAVSSLVFVTGITLVMGLVRQVSADQMPADATWLSRMISSWPFFLCYLWMVTALGLATLRVACRFKPRRIPFVLSHAGLLVSLLSATLGSADMQRVRMVTSIGGTEWRGTDESGRMVELPVAIELHSFSIDEYPPKLMLIDNETGHAIPGDSPGSLPIDEGVTEGELSGWHLFVLEDLPMAAAVVTDDTVKFTEFHSIGAAYAVYVKAVCETDSTIREGWVSCGSFMFPYKALRLSDRVSVVMPDREPRRFVSDVTVYAEDGTVVTDDIEVNRPLDVAGWKIYQLSYDETKGRWSDVSVFELVRDPWLNVVYAGMAMMILGAICMFLWPYPGNIRIRKGAE